MTAGSKPAGRTSGLSTVLRVIVVWLLTAAALHLMSAILSGFVIEGEGSALAAAAAIGLVNALVWPLVIRVALPFTVLTLGLGVLALNGLVVYGISLIEPGMHVSTVGAGVAVAIGDHGRQHARDVAACDRRRRFLLPKRPQAPGAPPRGARRRDRRARRLLPRDRRARPRGGAASHPRRPPADARELDPGGRAHPAAVGDRLVLADRGLPGRAAARVERGHAGVSLVGEGPRQADRHQPPEGRRGDRAPPLRRQGAAPRGRRQPREHPLRRRAAHAADDEHGARPRPARPPRRRTTTRTSRTPTASPARSP